MTTINTDTCPFCLGAGMIYNGYDDCYLCEHCEGAGVYDNYLDDDVQEPGRRDNELPVSILSKENNR